MYTRLGFIALAVLTTVAAGIVTPGSDAAPATVSLDRRECPHDWDPQMHADSIRPRVTVTPGSPGDNISIPEFHDCQRLLIERTGTARGSSPSLVFGPYAAVFAREGLDKLFGRLPVGSASRWRGAAEVWSEAAYGPLGIAQGQNCLYLRFDEGRWSAAMLAAPAGLTRPQQRGFCLREYPSATIPGAHRLEARPSTFAGLENDDYPPVARWDFDVGRREQYIGVKCGAAWCEVGRAGFGSSPGFPDPGGTNEARRIRLVKGWYDQQILATLPAAGDPVPTRIIGTFFPAENLETLNSWSLFEATWRRVGEIHLLQFDGGDPAAMAKYRSHFGWVDTGPAADVSIALCYGTQAACGVNPLLLTAPCISEELGDDPPGTTDTGKRWWSRSQSNGVAPKYQCIARYHGPKNTDGSWMRIPGTVRWRWKVDDDGGWMRCIFGCCELL